MKHFHEIKAGANIAEAHATFAHELYKTDKPISVQKLRKCQALVLKYLMPNDYIVHLLMSYDTIVAMIDENGDGIDFLRYVYGYTATSAQHIRNFFDDYCAENADIYIYKP